jgi:hypothetical protein
MKQDSSKNNKVVLVVITVTLIFIISASAAGYYSYKKFVKSNIVNTPNETTSPTSSPSKPENSPKESLKLEDYNGDFFGIKKPAGWQISTGGNCATFSIVMQDQSNPLRKIFYFGEMGPVYLSENQKRVDEDYMNMGGYKVLWYEMPVINPLNPENFLKNMYKISATDFIKQFMTSVPSLDQFEMISSENANSIVSGDTKLIRGLFKENNQIGEGLFFLTTAELLPESNLPSGGIGYAFTLIGVSSEKSAFKDLEGDLLTSIRSFHISDSYVSNCVAEQNEQAKAALRISQTLSETSDIIMQGWENRNKSDDIISEKRSDAMLGRDRVYNPDTGNVYDVENGWYDSYNINRENYNLNNLQKLPDGNWDLWTAPTLSENKID